MKTRSLPYTSRLAWSLGIATALAAVALPVLLSHRPDSLATVSIQRTALPASHGLAPRTSAHGALHVGFEANEGQTDSEVRFLARAAGYTAFLTPEEVVLVLGRTDAAAHNQNSAAGFDAGRSVSDPVRPVDASATGRLSAPVSDGEILDAGFGVPGEREPTDRRPVIRMRFAGVDRATRVEGEEELSGRSNYFTGNDSGAWRTEVPRYRRVRYHDLYPGVDFVSYAMGNRLKYDFIVAPGADPGGVVLAFEGVDWMDLDAKGNLNLHAGTVTLTHHASLIYQEIDGVRNVIDGRYVLLGGGQVGFEIAPYDPGLPLVIDPVVSYATYLGGSGSDEVHGIAVDVLGNAYVVGHTSSTDFPVSAGAFQTSPGSPTDVFVAKISPDGSELLYATYIGGRSFDLGYAIAIDDQGAAYVTGHTHSNDFPTTSLAFQSEYSGSADGFVTKLSPSGSSLIYSTYLTDGTANGIAVDGSGNAYVTGGTSSDAFPTTAGAFQPNRAENRDAFVARINPSGSTLGYGTYIGGRLDDVGTGIALDADGSAYVTGFTRSSDFPRTTGASHAAYGGSQVAFVAKLAPDGAALVYARYLGGNGLDIGHAIAVSAAGSAFVTGGTAASDFEVTSGAFQTSLAGDSDVFIAKLIPDGSSLAYATYIGGAAGDDGGRAIAVDSLGNAYVTGQTASDDLPVTAGVLRGMQDAFVAKLSADGSTLVYGTYLGGNEADFGLAIALDAAENVYVAGMTSSEDVLTTTESLQPAYGGGSSDGFIVKIEASTGTSTEHAETPEEFLTAIPGSILPNVPNPFRSTTEIGYQLTEPRNVTLAVYDLLGRQVRVLAQAYHPAGTYRVMWDGRDASGHQAAAGTYFYQIVVDGRFVETKQMLLVR